MASVILKSVDFINAKIINACVHIQTDSQYKSLSMSILRIFSLVLNCSHCLLIDMHVKRIYSQTEKRPRILIEQTLTSKSVSQNELSLVFALSPSTISSTQNA